MSHGRWPTLAFHLALGALLGVVLGPRVTRAQSVPAASPPQVAPRPQPPLKPPAPPPKAKTDDEEGEEEKADPKAPKAKDDTEEGGDDEGGDEEEKADPKAPKGSKKKRGKKERGWGWSPVVYGRLSTGYDSNVSLNEFQKLGDAPASPFLRLRASAGAYYQGEELTVELTYQASQLFYFQQSSLDQMGHAAKASLSWERERFELSASFETEFQWFTNGVRFYGLEHELALGGNLLLSGNWWLALRYGFAYYDVRDSAFQPLAGQHHGVRFGPEYRFGDVGKIGARYALDVTRIGIDSTALRGRNAMASVLFDIPLSYDGHGGTLYGSYWPHENLELTAEAGASHRVFPEVSGAFTGPRGTRTLTRPRADTVVDLSAAASWSFWGALSADLSVAYRLSDSNFEGQRFTGSYQQFVATVGLTYYN